MDFNYKANTLIRLRRVRERQMDGDTPPMLDYSLDYLMASFFSPILITLSEHLFILIHVIKIAAKMAAIIILALRLPLPLPPSVSFPLLIVLKSPPLNK